MQCNIFFNNKTGKYYMQCYTLKNGVIFGELTLAIYNIYIK